MPGTPDSRPTAPDHSAVAGGLGRRHALSGAAVVGLGVPFLVACGGDEPPEASDPGSTESDGGSPDAGDEGSEAPAAGPLATTDEIPVGGGTVFSDDKVVVTQPEAGTFQAFSVTCTHQGCPVTGVSETIDCSCHGSKFALTDGAPVSGPATSPLSAVEITVDGDRITLA